MADLPDGNQVANLSIPGLLGALLAFYVFLPPHPLNTIPVVVLPALPSLVAPTVSSNVPPNSKKDSKKEHPTWRDSLSHKLFNFDGQQDAASSPLRGTSLRVLLTPGMLPKDLRAAKKDLNAPNNGAPAQDSDIPCRVTEYQLDAEPHFPPFQPWESKTLQLYMEEQQESLQECLALEVSEDGKEKSENDADARQIITLEKARDGSGALGAQFEDFRSPTAAIANARTATVLAQLKRLQDRVEKREVGIRRRDYEIAELKRFSGWLDARLADPDRLRPEQSLGDYLKALSDHVTGFLTLVASIGTIFKVLISPAGSKLIYKLLFNEEM